MVDITWYNNSSMGLWTNFNWLVFTGNYRTIPWISWENPWFPLQIFPNKNQPIEIPIPSPAARRGAPPPGLRHRAADGAHPALCRWSHQWPGQRHGAPRSVVPRVFPWLCSDFHGKMGKNAGKHGEKPGKPMDFSDFFYDLEDFEEDLRWFWSPEDHRYGDPMVFVWCFRDSLYFCHVNRSFIKEKWWDTKDIMNDFWGIRWMLMECW